MEFDMDTERCPECDGHFRHFAPCPFYRGEPGLPLETRVALYADIYAGFGDLSGCGTTGCEAHDGECMNNWGAGESDPYGGDDASSYYNFGMG